MIDFPIDDLLDEQASLAWLERQLHPEGLKCPRCGSQERRVARHIRELTAYRCRTCDRYHTVYTGTIFEKTRQPPSKIVLILRGIAKGEPTARLARELGIGRVRVHEIRKRVQEHLDETLPTDLLRGQEFEADELYQNAGEKKRAAQRPGRPAQTAGKQAQRARDLRQ